MAKAVAMMDVERAVNNGMTEAVEGAAVAGMDFAMTVVATVAIEMK